MSYPAQVYKVMIASPSDVSHERKIIRDVIHEWNSIHSEDRGIVLLPVGWETHSSPSMEGRPQEVINKQILADSDLLVTAFWTRIGTPTGKAKSGTIEEIEKHLAAEKPAMIYFSSAPVRLDSVDEEQYKELKRFHDDLLERGLIETYETLSDFKDKFSRQLAQTVIRYFASGVSIDQEIAQSLDRHEETFSRISISSDASELLMAAAESSDGYILSVKAVGGWSLQAGGRNFVVGDDPRTEARWESALEELIQLDLIRDQGYKREVFRITALGYDVADSLALENR